MKKTISFIVITVMIFVLSACDTKESKKPQFDISEMIGIEI